MADQITTKITGGRELDRALAKMEAKVARKTMRQALFHATLPVLQAAKANAQSIRDSGALALSIRRFTRTMRLRTGSFMEVAVGQHKRAARALAAYNAFHGREESPATELRHGFFSELGTEDTPVQPWLRPAFDSNADNMIVRLMRRLREQITAGMDRI